MKKSLIELKLINLLKISDQIDLDNFDFKKFKNKNILITGGSGLIGLKIIFYLNEINNRYNLNLNLVITYKTYIFPFVKKYFSRNRNIKLLKINLFKSNIPISDKFDFIFHCAGYGQPAKFMRYSFETYYIHSALIFNLQKNLKKNGTFVFLSSSEIYSGNNGSCDENTIGKTMPNHPRSTYIESKRFAESAIMNMFSNFFIFRVCLSYGPGAKLNDERVLNQVLLRSIINNSIEVYGGHDQMRANLYIDDSVNLLLRTVSSGNVGIYNLSSSEIYRLGYIFEIISRVSKKKLVEKNNNQIILGAPKNIKISNKKILSLNKIKPKININMGISLTYEWYKLLIQLKKDTK